MKKRKALSGIIGLLALALTLSAFTTNNRHYLKRIELAMLIQEILCRSCCESDEYRYSPHFADIDADEIATIAAVTGQKIMNGFADGTFRPEEPLRNHEVLHYLHRTWQFLHKNARENTLTSQLGRMVGMGRKNFYRHNVSSYSIFAEAAKPGDFAETCVISRIRNGLLLDDDSDQVVITVNDALSAKPVGGAFAVIDRQVFVTDDSGRVSMQKYRFDSHRLEILVTSEGYHPIKLKRNLLQKNVLHINLRPLKGKIRVTAVDEETGRQIDKFSAHINGEIAGVSESGELILKPEYAGYHQIRVVSEDGRSFKKNVYSSEGITDIEAVF